jgi:hypothetical protein
VSSNESVEFTVRLGEDATLNVEMPLTFKLPLIERLAEPAVLSIKIVEVFVPFNEIVAKSAGESLLFINAIPTLFGRLGRTIDSSNSSVLKSSSSRKLVRVVASPGPKEVQ